MVNIQGGFEFQLPKYIGLEVEGYGVYPLGSELIATEVIRKGKVNKQLNSAGDAEDNGANIALDFPIHPHVSASIFYSRSQYLDIDTVGITITLLLRAPKSVAK
jgi:hypothetical protein